MEKSMENWEIMENGNLTLWEVPRGNFLTTLHVRFLIVILFGSNQILHLCNAAKQNMCT